MKRKRQDLESQLGRLEAERELIEEAIVGIKGGLKGLRDS